MEEIKIENWFVRNWKWAVPTGGCLVVIMGIALFVGTIFLAATSMMKNSTAYQDSLTRVNESSEAVAIFGKPIKAHGIAGGNVNSGIGFERAKLTIPIKGPKREGSLIVEGENLGPGWIYEEMRVVVEGSDKVIDLLAMDKR